MLFLLVLTLVFACLCRGPSAKSVEHPLEEVPTGESEGAEPKRMVQIGYSPSIFGTMLYWLWVLLPLFGYGQMVWLTLDYYFYKLHSPDLTWAQLAEPFLLVFILSHVI